MASRWRIRTLLAAIVLILSAAAHAQQTVGLFLNEEGASDGFTLFSPGSTTTTYLIDAQGKLIHTWPSDYPTGNVVYLLEDGSILRAGRYAPTMSPRIGAGGAGGRIQRIAWDGTLLWDFAYSDDFVRAHHDIEPLPDGNVLIIAWEYRTMAEAIQAGRDPANMLDDSLWPDTIVELEPDGLNGANIVWKWDPWDHLIQDFDSDMDNFGVVADHPERIDINYSSALPTADWMHANAVDYDPVLDQILFSVPFLREVWIIDHSTTTAEAAGSVGGNAGRGGDLLYRWGNPEAYGRGTSVDIQLWNQHGPNWIEPGLTGGGNILIFNNGDFLNEPTRNFSTVIEIVPPLEPGGAYTDPGTGAYGPAVPSWTYAGDGGAFFAGFLSNAQRLPNGNTFINFGPGADFTEIDADQNVVWRYRVPVGSTGVAVQGESFGAQVFRANRYPRDYPGVLSSVPGDPIEQFTRPLPAPDGQAGTTALLAGRQGGGIDVSWDTSSCTSSDYNLLYGDLSGVATTAIDGARCDLGTTGSFGWTDPPAGSLFFVIVGSDDLDIYESSWGLDSEGLERNGTSPSGQCGVTSKVVSGSCAGG